jgi:hypothetical protein
LININMSPSAEAETFRDDAESWTGTGTDDAASPLLSSSPSASATASSRAGLSLRGGTLSVLPDSDGNGEHYSYAYAYGPPGLAGLRANTYALRCAAFASLGGLTFGYDQGVIANVLVMQDFVARWPVGPWERGLMSAPLLVPFIRLTVTACFFCLFVFPWERERTDISGGT